jgi:hypothetical protein
MGHEPSLKMVVDEWRRGLRPNWTPPAKITELPETVTLWRPVGEAELRLIEASGWRAFPPRLPAYEAQQVGGRTHLEYWIPAADLGAFNDAIVGQITAEFH